MPDERTARWWYTRRLVFAAPFRRDAIETMISVHLDAAAEFLAEELGGASLYVAGSLARGEPAVSSDSAGMTLVSDIDFIVVSDDAIDTTRLEAKLREHFPEYRDTVYRIRPAVVESLCSFSGRDLGEGMTRPLIGNASARAPRPQLGVAERMEVVIYQIAGVLMHSSQGPYWQRGGDYQGSKAVTDLLRMAAHAAGADATLQDAFALRHSSAMTSLVASDVLEDIIRERESWRGHAPVATASFRQIVRAGVCLLLDLSRSCSPETVLEHAQQLLYPDAEVLHQFPLHTLAAVLLPDRMIARRHVESMLETSAEYMRQLTARKDAGGSAWRPSREAALRA